MKSFFPFWRLQYLNRLRPRLLELLQTEWNFPLSKQFSLRERLALWKDGFLSESGLLYDFENHARGDYLNDYARFTKARMNGVYTTLLDNKVMFDAVMRPFQQNIPKSYAVLINKKFQSLMQDPRMCSPQAVVDWCMAGNDIVLKPLDGGGGSGIKVITEAEGELFRNGERIGADELARMLAGLDRYLIQEKIEQADYARVIYPRATNTIRALTMWNTDSDKPFIATAVHRFGSDRSSRSTTLRKADTALQLTWQPEKCPKRSRTGPPENSNGARTIPILESVSQARASLTGQPSTANCSIRGCIPVLAVRRLGHRD